MAGSYKHIIDESGKLLSNDKFIDLVDNLGDAYEMAEECWYIIQILSGGDNDKIENAINSMYKILNAKNVINNK